MARSQASPTTPETDVLCAAVLEAMEDAALRGLCREGQVEVAAGRLRDLRPDWDAETALAFVLSL